MNSNRQLQGRQSRALGESFEQWIEASLNYYEWQKIACISKTPEPVKILSKVDHFGRFQACFVKKAQPDFKGTLCDGTCIIFEAKHTEKDRILQSAVTDEQAEIFDKYQLMGAKCFVMVSLGLQSFYRIPWAVWSDMKQITGHKYMNADDLAAYRLKSDGMIIKLLDGIELRD